MTYSDLRSAILMDFSMDELECTSLIDEGMMRFLVESKSTMYKCQIFEYLTGKMVADVQTGAPQLGPVECNYDFVLKNDVLSYFKLITYKEAWISYYHAMFE